MIRINLLSEGRRPVVARKSKPKLSFGDQDPSIFMLTGGLLLGLLVVAVQWFLISSEISDLDGRIRVKKREVADLKPILKEVQDFKDAQAELERKIQVITDLRTAQQGPVHIMSEVSTSLPDLVWLSSMNVRGRGVAIKGNAFNTNAVATFIENLNNVEDFKEPDTRNINQARGGETYSFQISFNFDPKRQEVLVEEEEGDV